MLVADEENPVISPLSAYYALSMAALGANGSTLAEFEYVPGMSSRQLAPALFALSQDLTTNNRDTVINLAGSVWVNDEYTVKPAFNQDMTDYLWG